MSETKHTPGKWSFETFQEREFLHWILSDSNGNHIASNSCDIKDSAVRLANARLIAKAPELLEALEMMVTFNCRKCNLLNHAVSCGTCFILEHKQLIAEAKGEKQ